MSSFEAPSVCRRRRRPTLVILVPIQLAANSFLLVFPRDVETPPLILSDAAAPKGEQPALTQNESPRNAYFPFLVRSRRDASMALSGEAQTFPLLQKKKNRPARLGVRRGVFCMNARRSAAGKSRAILDEPDKLHSGFSC